MPDDDSKVTDTVLEAQSAGLGGWRTALQNYRDLIELDNTLVFRINVVTIAIGAAMLQSGGAAITTIVGIVLVVAGALGILDAIYGRVVD